ncbi:hypothetical protein [Pontitalea aquivivens]|uniref:hypothetical protein n=1 Tax=Pontitalea aquivivens TaxID=3388663 RepID=UPI0039710F2C
MLMAAARAEAVREALRVSLPVGDLWATVLVAESCAQVIWHRFAPDGAPIGGRALMNEFLTEGHGDQLRALAVAVDQAVASLKRGSK